MSYDTVLCKCTHGTCSSEFPRPIARDKIWQCLRTYVGGSIHKMGRMYTLAIADS